MGPRRAPVGDPGVPVLGRRLVVIALGAAVLVPVSGCGGEASRLGSTARTSMRQDLARVASAAAAGRSADAERALVSFSRAVDTQAGTGRLSPDQAAELRVGALRARARLRKDAASAAPPASAADPAPAVTAPAATSTAPAPDAPATPAVTPGGPAAPGKATTDDRAARAAREAARAAKHPARAKRGKVGKDEKKPKEKGKGRATKAGRDGGRAG